MGRLRGLDGIRGLAILAVVLGHSYPFRYAMGGVAGVTLFFVLSGFLITRILLEETSLRRFYIRRAYRLFPALMVFLLAAGFYFGWEEALAPALYVSNYAQIISGEISELAHTWSLAVEEHFYFVWPILVLTAPAVRKLRVLASAIVLLLVWRLVVPNDLWAYQGTLTNAYALGLGCLLVFVADRWEPTKLLYGLSLVCWIAVGFYPVTNATYTTVGRWLAPLAALSAFFMVWGTIKNSFEWLEWRPLAAAGRVSYGWYLWHPPFVLWFFHHHRSWVLVGAALSFGVALLSWRLIEQPALRWRDRARSAPGELSPTMGH
ncbi:MAG: acyltransferase [Acidimicrobiia bacterium]